MTQDPFGQPAPSAPAGDPFGQPSTGGGKFPKPIDLFGELVLLTPIKVEQVPDQHNPGKMKDQLTADTVILTGDLAGEEFHGMWWNQSPIANAGSKALRANVPAILGRLYRYPTNADRKAGKFTTKEDLEKGLAAARPGEKISFAWSLEQYTEADAQIARDFLAARTPKSPFDN